jgi:hypothetical protein
VAYIGCSGRKSGVGRHQDLLKTEEFTPWRADLEIHIDILMGERLAAPKGLQGTAKIGQ